MISADLVALKQRVLDAEQEYLFWGAVNTSGQTTEKLVEIDIRYHKAAREFASAKAHYEAALCEASR